MLPTTSQHCESICDGINTNSPQCIPSYLKSLEYSLPEEEAGFQIPPPSDDSDSDPMKNSPTSPMIIDVPTPLAADDERDFRRQCKMANSFIAVYITVSFSLIVMISVPKDPDWVFLSAIDPVLGFTSLVCSFGLLFYSLRSQPGAELAKVQWTVMGFSAVVLLFAATSRFALQFPCQLLLPSAAIVVMLIALLILLLYFTRYKK